MNNENILKRLALAAACAGLSLACSTVHSVQTGPPAPATPAANTTASLTTSPPPPAQSEEDKMPRTTAQEAIKLYKAGEAVIVDVRSEDSYRMSHAKGALNIPLNRIESGEHKLPKDVKIISYCT
ncbi:MAG TPA: rhodanese-like domain-containing protein [Blastocatellia bacterium]|nr:rhodanese-like domain-containing protein [Blastocatellia bacterium]